MVRTEMRSLSLTKALSVGAAIVACTAACSGSPSVDGDPLDENLFAEPSIPYGGEGESRSPTSAKRDAGAATSKSGTDAANGTTPKSGGDGGPTSSPEGGAAPGPCAGESTAASCYRCCEQRYPNGVPVLRQASQVFDDCACVSHGACSSQCAATYCGGLAPLPASACDLCLAALPLCEQRADTVCEADADCAAILSCDDASQCGAKS